ncbi:MAG: hypothetical protein RR396_03235 [Clostridiales bacterium]
MDIIEKRDLEQPHPLLAGELKKGQLSHAYLLQGKNALEQGKYLAKAANCLNLEKGLPCGICPVCRKIDKEIFADLQIIAPQKGSLKIEQMRHLQNQAYLEPLEGKTKIFIVQDAHCLTESAANSLLKILEDPPSKTIIILLAENGHKLLSTILSRCRTYNFGQEGFAFDELLLEEILPKAEDFLSSLPNIDCLPVLNIAKIYEKDKDGLLYFFLAVLRLLHQGAKGGKCVFSPNTALKGALFIERAIGFLQNNINQRLLTDITFLRLWQMAQKDKLQK